MRNLSKRAARRIRSRLAPSIPDTEPLSLDQLRSTPPLLTFFHRLTFFLSVLACLGVHTVALLAPRALRYVYVVGAPPLLFLRRRVYRTRKWQYFMLDFCYFTNYALFFAVLTDWPSLWRCVFVWANGPVAMAIVTWRNASVFHSLDKMTTFAIHALPAIVTCAERWRDGGAGWHGDEGETWMFWASLAGYVLWQALYLVQTEYVDRERLDADPDLLTSLRWIATNRKGGTHRAAAAIARALGLLKPGERVRPEDFKIKCIFVFFQLLYTIVGTLWAALVLDRCMEVHIAWLVLCMSVAVWNGATFYFEVFASRYDGEVREGRQTLYALAKAPKREEDEKEK